VSLFPVVRAAASSRSGRGCVGGKKLSVAVILPFSGKVKLARRRVCCLFLFRRRSGTRSGLRFYFPFLPFLCPVNGEVVAQFPLFPSFGEIDYWTDSSFFFFLRSAVT